LYWENTSQINSLIIHQQNTKETNTVSLSSYHGNKRS
jgi:hypothetical protein